MSGRRLLFALGLAATMLHAPSALALPKIISRDFPQNVNPGEPITVNVAVENTENTSQFVEVDVTIVNTETGQESTLIPVLTATLTPRETRTLSGSYASPLQQGNYTVVFPLYDGNGVKIDSVRGRFPLRVGTETESIRVFPEAIHLGTLPPGRHMFPTPIEVRWSFFQFNRISKDQPFTIRIYTDNAARYEGIPHAIGKVSPAGLVSLNGRYVIPLKCWSLNFGPDVQATGWDAKLAGPPPVDEDDSWIGPPLLEGARNYGSASWVRIPDLVDMTPDPTTWRRLIGRDQYDTRLVTDTSPTGDATLESPFTFYLATEAGPTAVEGSYASNLVVELWNP